MIRDDSYRWHEYAYKGLKMLSPVAFHHVNACRQYLFSIWRYII